MPIDSESTDWQVVDSLRANPNLCKDPKVQRRILELAEPFKSQALEICQ